MGFVLEHVDDPSFIIKKYIHFLKPDGIVFIAVPNARSLHRLIGEKAGMLDSLYKLSRHDVSLGHKRYFDMESFVKLVLESGLKITNIEGIYMKPFSTGQLKSLKLAPEITYALCEIGQTYPEICNALFMEATL
jgi:2-polyprenyl-3-methyl-5-hydroxy-6-metoxy-1,4-benzoquinol methylase